MAVRRQLFQPREVGPIQDAVAAAGAARLGQHPLGLIGRGGHVGGQKVPAAVFSVLFLHRLCRYGPGVDQQTLRILRRFQQRFDVVVVVFQPEHVQHLRLRHKAGNVGEHRLALRAQRRLQGRLIVYGRVAPLAQQLGARLDGGCRQQLLQPLCRQQPALHGAYAGGQEQIVRVLSPFCQRDAPFQSNSTAATAEESSCRARRSSSAKPQLISMRPRCSTTPPPVSRVSAASVKPAPGFLPLAASTTA